MMYMDKHWLEVMDMAEKHGFIIHSTGGVAILATHEVQKEQYGENGHKRIQKMNGREVTDNDA